MTTFTALADLVADAEDLLSRLRNQSGPEVAALVSKVEASIGDVRDQARSEIDQARNSLQRATESLFAAVGKNPWIAIAIGVTVSAALLYAAFAHRDEA